jgi:GTP-binding protein Era
VLDGDAHLPWQGHLDDVLVAVAPFLGVTPPARETPAEVEELTEKVVRATIYVETESQKQIVVGRGGSVVREIGTRARPEVEHLLGHSVFLELNVKARPRWRRDQAMLERLGI